MGVPVQQSGYLHDSWLNLFYSSIEEGNTLYDGLVKDLGVLDLSIEEVSDRLGSSRLNVESISPSLPVSFSDSVETATVLYQLRQVQMRKQKQVVLFIHRARTSAFLICADGTVLYADSHPFGDDGS